MEQIQENYSKVYYLSTLQSMAQDTEDLELQDNQIQHSFWVMHLLRGQVSHHAVHFPDLLEKPYYEMEADFALVEDDRALGHIHLESTTITGKGYGKNLHHQATKE